MTHAEKSLALADAAPLRGRGAYREAASLAAVEFVPDVAALAPAWDRLVAAGGATPYQARAYVSAWADHAGAAEGSRLAALAFMGERQRLVMILPLALGRLGPLRVARYPGGKHANFNMPIVDPAAAAPDPATLRRLLVEGGRKAGVDLFDLRNQPAVFEGRRNPFAPLASRPSPSFAMKTRLACDPDAMIEARLSADARSKLRRKEKKLAALGPLRYFRADDAATARRVLDVFLAHKRARLAQAGIPDAFAEPGIEAFLREAACAAFARGETPPLRLYALTAGDRIVATYGGLHDRQRFCGLFTAFDGSEDVYRWSPGDHLLLWLIRSLCEQGLRTFDLGVGEARYKSAYCDEVDPLFDCTLPVTLAGTIAAGAVAAAARTKRAVKQDERLMGMIAAARRWRARSATRVDRQAGD